MSENIRIWHRGNYVYCVKTTQGGEVQKRDFKSDVKVTQDEEGGNDFVIQSDDLGIGQINISNIKKQNGDPYTSEEFLQWADDNTGFNTAEGGSSAWGHITGVLSNQTDLTNELSNKIESSEKGVSLGVAELDSGGKVPISQIPVSVQGGLTVIGTWNATTNTPDLSSLTLSQGEAYQVAVQGNTTINGESNWKAKDLAAWSNSLTGNWYKLDNTDDVLSVSGKTGAVTLNADDVTDFDTEVSNNSNVAANTLKVGITQQQADDIEANNQKVSFNKSVYDPNNVDGDAFDYGNFLGVFQIKGSTTTVSMSSDKDNLDVDGFNIVYLTSSSQDRRITGIKAPSSGVNRVICFISNTSNRIMFMGNSGNSLAENRILLRNNTGSRNLLQYQVIFAVYNHVLNKYHIIRMA